MKRNFLIALSFYGLLFSQSLYAGMSFDDTQEAALNFYFKHDKISKGFDITLPITLNSKVAINRPMEVNNFPTIKVAIKQTVHGLDIEFYNKENGQLISRMNYPTSDYLENTFKTRGFTGLQYIYHPNGSVLQFTGMVK